MKYISKIIRRSSGYYDANHLIKKNLKRLHTTARNRGPALNLKRGENKGVSKTTCSMKE